MERERERTSDAVRRARRGRPPAFSDAERRKVVFDTLDEIFAHSGLEGISMTAVAQHAGMSKRTLYAIFSDRTALLVAYLERMKAGSVHPVGPEATSAPIETRLRHLLSPSPIGTGLQLPLSILRVIVAEGPNRPELGKRLLQSACVDMQEHIRTELDRAVERAEILPGDTGEMAALLLDMVRPSPMEALLCPDCVPTTASLQRRFDLAIRIFLDGVRPADERGA